MTRHFTILCILISLLSNNPTFASSSKREFRGVWVATVWGLDWPSLAGKTEAIQKKQKEELLKMLDRFESLNFTTVCFQVRSMGDVMYNSELEPWSTFLTGKRGEDPGWDPLEFIVDECHNRGLECYAWVNPFRWSTGTDYSTPQDNEWKKRGWLLKHGKYTVFNPGREDVRQHVVDICREIVTGYEVDGLIFDDYFYPNRIPETSDMPDYQDYINETPWISFGDWRRANVHKAVADVYAMIEEERPDIVFGISPAGVAGKDDTSSSKWGMEPITVKAADWQYNEIYSDPLGLLYERTVDFISPQIYWHTDHALAPYAPIAQWWSEAANLYGRHFYGSVTLEHVGSSNTALNRSQIIEQVGHNRSLSLDGNSGVIMYSAKNLPKLQSDLMTETFSHPVLTPVMPWKHQFSYSAPKGLKINNGVLSWEPVQPEDVELVRYTVYAIPTDVSPDEAMDEFDDGIKGEYLLGVTYNNEKKVPIGNYTYAVCTYSPQSVESTPTFLR